MDEHRGIPLNCLQNDPNFDFISQFSKMFNDDDDQNYSPYGDNDLTCDYLDEEKFIERYSKSDKNVIMSLNVQSLNAKFAELSEFINTLSLNNCNPCIIALQELWALQDPDVFHLNGYHKLVFKSRENSQGGGVGLYIANDLKFKNRPDLSIFVDKIYESIFIEISLPKCKKLIVGSVYRPNSSYINVTASEQLTLFNDQMLSVLSAINDNNSTAYILGDFNLDVLKLCNHGPTSEYVENLFSMGYLQLITKPTRCSGPSATLIDHILTNEAKNSYNSGIIITRISDHFPIFHELSDKKIKRKQSPI